MFVYQACADKLNYELNTYGNPPKFPTAEEQAAAAAAAAEAAAAEAAANTEASHTRRRWYNYSVRQPVEYRY
jgi:hypothetical protein